MTWIAVDIDDTLYNFNQLARERFAEVAIERGDKKLHRGAYIPWSEWRSPSEIGDDPELWAHVIDRCHSSEAILSQQPYEGASETLRVLVESGYRLRYISNRNSDAASVTRDWLEDKWFPMNSNTELICTTDDKIRLISDCQYLIDDRPKTLVEFVYNFGYKYRWGSMNREKARLGFGIFGEYNRSLTDVPGIYLAPNWTLLRFFLEERGVLNARDSASASVAQ